MSIWSGHDRQARVFHVDYGKVERIVALLAHRMSGMRFDAVVGIARAGVVPATMFAQRLGAELHLLRCQRHATDLTWLGPSPKFGARVLLVDDIVSRGTTMRKVRDRLVDLGYEVAAAALYVDRARSSFQPDFALDAPGFIRFAWDRRETTPEARSLIAAGIEALPPELETESFGVDMDGVLLPDIRKPHYRRNLELSLRRRHALPPFSRETLPDIDWSKAHIVTGRPDEDYDMTRSWLDQHGFSKCKLYCRNPLRHAPSAEGACAHKIATLTEIGVSTFIESELIQATLIAEACPTVDVVWWGRRRRLLIGGVTRPSFDPFRHSPSETSEYVATIESWVSAELDPGNMCFE